MCIKVKQCSLNKPLGIMWQTDLGVVTEARANRTVV